MGSRSKSSLFLMELIIAIAFFSFNSAICVQLFAKAHTLSEKSSGVSMAISTAQSAAECFKATDADAAAMSAILGTISNGSALTARYDDNWQPVAENGRYILTVEMDTASVPAAATISVTDTAKGTLLHHLVAKKYIR